MATRDRIERRHDNQYVYTGRNLLQSERDANARAAAAQDRFNRLAGISGGEETRTRNELARLRTLLTRQPSTGNRYVYRSMNGTRYNSQNRTGDGRIGLRQGVGTTSRLRREYITQPAASSSISNSPPGAPAPRIVVGSRIAGRIRR